jgi:hypothetical protein
MAEQVDPTLPQSAFPYPAGSVQPGGDFDVVTASGPVTRKQGTVFLNGSGVLHLTIAAPNPGISKDNGDDDNSLTFVNVDGHAHVITGPTNSLNGANHIATAGGAKGDSITLKAYGGSWYTEAGSGFVVS